MNKTVRTAVVGGGNMGVNHLRKYKQIKDATLIAVADPNPAVRDIAKEYGIKYYENYEDMVATEKLDAVSVVVPTQLHYPVAKHIMLHGIHCLVEKPIASTIEQANDLATIAKQSNLVFAVGHVEHYNPMVTKLKELITDGVVGEVTSIVCRRVGGFPPREPATDVILDLAVHDIGVMNYLLNKKPTHVSSHASQTHHSHKVDAAELLLDYGQASGFVQVNWTTPIKVRSIAITGSRGYIEANYLTQEIDIYESNIQKVTNENFETFISQVGEPLYTTVKTEFQEPLLVELTRFIEHISGNSTGYLVSAEEAINALKPTLEVSIRSM